VEESKPGFCFCITQAGQARESTVQAVSWQLRSLERLWARQKRPPHERAEKMKLKETTSTTRKSAAITRQAPQFCQPQKKQVDKLGIGPKKKILKVYRTTPGKMGGNPQKFPATARTRVEKPYVSQSDRSLRKG